MGHREYVGLVCVALHCLTGIRARVLTAAAPSDSVSEVAVRMRRSVCASGPDYSQELCNQHCSTSCWGDWQPQTNCSAQSCGAIGSQIVFRGVSPECEDHVTGDACSGLEIEFHPCHMCQNGGSPVNGACACPPGYTGACCSQRCMSSCEGAADGNYQSCDVCTGYVACSADFRYEMPCPPGLFWDDALKRCEFASNTCASQP